MPYFEVKYADCEPRVIEAATRGQAAYSHALTVSDVCFCSVGDAFKHIRTRKADGPPPNPEAEVVKRWNTSHGVGVPVRYWTGERRGTGQRSHTRSKAQLLGGHTAVVWVEGHPACISLTHVEIA